MGYDSWFINDRFHPQSGLLQIFSTVTYILTFEMSNYSILLFFFFEY